MHETFAQFASKSHGMLQVQDAVDDAEVVVQEPLPDEQRQEARHGPRDEDQRPVGALEAHAPSCRATIASSRPTANERKTTETAKPTVQMKIWKNGPRTSGSWMIVPKLREADAGLPARLELLRLPCDERAAAVVAEHLAVADPR